MPTRTSSPWSRAWASVSPTAPTSGSVKVTLGTAWYCAAKPGSPRMSATTIPAWYVDMWVNAPLPVMSPIAHTPGAARRWPSTGMAFRFSSMPTAPTPTAARSVRRPVATSSASPVRSPPPSRVTVKPARSCRTPVACWPVCTAMPSRPNTPASRSPASGSSLGSSRPVFSTTVTWLPNRAKTWPSSTPTDPPPRITSEPGTRSASTASRLVQNGVPARPGIGGTAGAVPVLMTIPRRARRTTWSSPSGRAGATVTSPGAVIRPRPRTRIPPLPVNRSAATVSSQSSVASSRIRRATGAQSGSTRAVPAMPLTRFPSMIRFAARIIILDGTQPK